MKKILFLIGFLLPFFAFSQDGESIDWSSARRLTWNDYLGRPSQRSDAAAVTNTSIGMEYHVKNNFLSYKITCSFSKTRSWGRSRTEYILSHEQGHFDITEIFARRLAKALKEYAFNPNRYQDDIGNIYKRIMDEKEKFQDDYDSETDFSRNKPKQIEWLKKISDELDELEEYKAYNLITPEKNLSSTVKLKGLKKGDDHPAE